MAASQVLNVFQPCRGTGQRDAGSRCGASEGAPPRIKAVPQPWMSAATQALRFHSIPPATAGARGHVAPGGGFRGYPTSCPRGLHPLPPPPQLWVAPRAPLTVPPALQLLLLGQPHAAAPVLAQHAVASGAVRSLEQGAPEQRERLEKSSTRAARGRLWAVRRLGARQAGQQARRAHALLHKPLQLRRHAPTAREQHQPQL